MPSHRGILVFGPRQEVLGGAPAGRVKEIFVRESGVLVGLGCPSDRGLAQILEPLPVRELRLLGRAFQSVHID